MALILDHTIVPAYDKGASARFFAHIFGLKYEGPVEHFAPVQVNETLTFDFDEAHNFESHHYAFHNNDEGFDAIFQRILKADIPYGSGPRNLENHQLNARNGGRGFYFRDSNGHILEIMTRI
jgi:catechol 2,3-dioxygenase-like lactoylglutathione lyase family enzyme